ncbi:MAG: S8 family serine peptidase [Nitrospirae bacterium]|nr:S8 family serine peptidase [Candidatus Manganitrophaceae bacterium]
MQRKVSLQGSRVSLSWFIPLFIGSLLLTACGGGGGGGKSSGAPAAAMGTASGKLSIPPNNTVEVEPNDSIAQPQPISSPIAVAGSASISDPGATLPTSDGEVRLPDIFKLTAAGPVRITLSIAANDLDKNDLDLVLMDTTGKVVDSSAGLTETELIETTAGGDFLVGVVAFAGTSAYVLNVAPIGSLSTAGEAVPPGADFVPGEVLVKLKQTGPGAKEKSASLAARHRLVQKQSLPQGVERMQATLPSLLLKNGTAVRLKIKTAKSAANELKALTLATIQHLQADPEVAYAEANFLRRPSAVPVPNDTHYPLQWDFALMNLSQAWEVTTGSDDIIVAVIDTGVLHHPDLESRLIAGYDFISDPATAGDGNGLDADPTDVGDDPKHQSSSFHGTHVAGTIGAVTNNGIGVAGITWQTKIMPLRVLGDGGGSDADIAQAIYYAAGLSNSSGTLPPAPARIINMSLGGSGFSQTMQDAITAARNANVIVVAAAGNENSSAPSSPASLEGVISVSAVDINSKKAPYSNYGRTVDVAAPGGNTAVDLNGDGFPDGILSTLGDDSGQFFYRFYQGTSMAAPHVAGVLALMLAVNPKLTPVDIDQLLAGTHPSTTQRITRDLGLPGRDDFYGHGLIDAALAVQAAKAVPGGGTQTIPTGSILTVSTPVLDFSNYISTLQIDIKNAGIGTLQVTGVSADAPWLTVTPASGTTPLTISATVDRTSLPSGSQTATITITSDASQGSRTATVEVRMSVGGATEGNVGTVFVLVINKETLETVDEAQTTADQHYAYTTPQTPAGTYLIAAGTDRDGDGVICDNEDACGFFPDDVTVKPGEDLPNINFSVGELASPQSVRSAAGLQGKKLRRLH